MRREYRATSENKILATHLMKAFGIRNYRSFSSDGVWFPEISKINIFIGKNNAGKSNVLKFLRDLSLFLRGEQGHELSSSEQKHWSEGDPPIVDFTVTLAELGYANWSAVDLNPDQHSLPPTSEIELRFGFDLTRNKCIGIDPFTSLKHNTPVYRRLWSSIGADQFPPPQDVMEKIFTNRNWQHQVRPILARDFKAVFYVPQFREIRTGGGNEDTHHVGGYQLAQKLAAMKSPSERRNSDQQHFYRIQGWIRELLDLPDLEIEFEYPNVQLVLLKANGLRRYLESFGTGIHQLVILCFAISLKQNHIVCIEEPESFLHPTLQRRFLEFLRTTDNTYVLSTHSNVFLDAAKQSDTKIYHIGYEEKASKATHVETTPDSYRVLEDLGYHASDLLQSNGVIWVEGPTDRHYLLKWLALSGCKAREDTDFTIMFYGGRLLTHLSFDSELSSELIPLLRLNRNAIVVLDSERTAKGKHLKSARKQLVSRIKRELGSTTNQFVWVTQGRDIENYIAEEALNKFAQAKWKSEYSLRYNAFQPLDEMLKWGKTRRKKFNYSNAKVDFCREIVPHLTKDHLDVLDLKTNLLKVDTIIRAWCPKRTIINVS